MDHIVFWSGAGFFSSYLMSNILIYYNNVGEAPLFSPFTFLGLIGGFIRGYTGKSVLELICS